MSRKNSLYRPLLTSSSRQSSGREVFATKARRDISVNSVEGVKLIVRNHGRSLAICAAFLFAACGDDAMGETDATGESAASTDSDADSSSTHDSTMDGAWFRPTVDMTWQWQLSAPEAGPSLTYDVAVYDVDLFDTPDATFQSLHTAGRFVVCYFSAGTYERWRPDAASIPMDARGTKLDGWDEEWLDIRHPQVMRVMEARLDLATTRGCDAVEPDNVDAYANRSGFLLTKSDQIAFNTALAHAAHERGLGIGLKNAVELVAELVPLFDFSVNEECHHYEECELLRPFIAAGKPVWNAEYSDEDSLSAAQALASQICASARAENFRTLILPLELDDRFRVSCDELSR